MWVGGQSASSAGQNDGRTISFAGDPSGAPCLRDFYDVTVASFAAGAFGTAHVARYINSGLDCIVKAIRKDLVGDKYTQTVVNKGRFEFALDLSRKKPHRNIVRYVDFFEDASYYYVVMEAVQGPELFEYVSAHFPVTEAYCRDVMRQMFEALHELHVVVKAYHRDLKFENFRHGKSGELVLLDFGFASMIGEPWDRNLRGSMMYVAPEVARTITLAKAGKFEEIHENGGYSPAVDLWAAGVMLYVLFTGRMPFSDDEVEALSDAGAADRAVADLLCDKEELSDKSEAALDLLGRLLTVDAMSRINVSQALEHRWFRQTEGASEDTFAVAGEMMSGGAGAAGTELDRSRAASGGSAHALCKVSSVSLNHMGLPE
jgi:serine/threonine protein kinase